MTDSPMNKRQKLGCAINMLFIAACILLSAMQFGCSTAFTVNGDAYNVRQGSVEKNERKKPQQVRRSDGLLTLAY